MSPSRPLRVLGVWPLARESVGVSTSRLAALSGFALLRGAVEAAVLVTVARVAAAIADDEDSLGISLGPLGEHTFSIDQALSLAALAAVLMLGLHLVNSYLSSEMSASALSRARRRLAGAFLEASWSTQSREREGQLQDVLTTYTDRVMQTANLMAGVLTASFNLLALVVTAMIVDLRVAVALVVAVALLMILLRPLTRLTRRSALANRDNNSSFATRLTEIVSMAQEITLFNVGRPVEERIGRSISKASRTQARITFLRGAVPGIYQGLAVLLVLGGLGVLASADATSVGELGAVVLLLIRSIAYGQQLQVVTNGLQEAAPYLHGIRDHETEYRRNRRHAGDGTIERIRSLELEHVTYRYEQDAQPALVDVSLTIEPGEVIGLIGPSGSGKSTLVQVLLRLRVPTDGALEVNGQPAEELALDGWYRRLAVVPQQPRLLEATVAENIGFFRADVDPSAVEDAARRAHIHDELVALPDGYATLLRGVGGGVSGGQAQRLCIARALAGHPELLVLDEPTSALDVHSEELIQQTLAELRGEVTMVVIAHRLSTLRLCNRIIVLENGAIRGIDTPERLENDNEYYRTAVRLSRQA